MALHVGAVWDVCGAIGTLAQLAIGSAAVHALAVSARALFVRPANATDKIVHKIADKIVHRAPLPQGLRGRPVSLTHVATNRSLACTYRGGVSTVWTLLEDDDNDGLYSIRCGDSAMTSVPLAVLPDSERVPRARQLWSFRPAKDGTYRVVAFRGAGDGQKVLAFARDSLELQSLRNATEQLWTIRPEPRALPPDTKTPKTKTPDKTPCAEKAGTCAPPPQTARPSPSPTPSPSPSPSPSPWRPTTLSSYDVMSYDNTEPGALNEWFVTQAFVDAVNVAAVHSDDWGAYKYHTVEILFRGKAAEFQVWDYCADKDCDGCCSENRGSNGFLLDLDSGAVERIWGVRNAEEDLLESASWRVLPHKTLTDPGAVAARYGGRPS